MAVYGKVNVIRQRWLLSEKVVEFGQSGCIRAKVVVFGQERLYSGKSGCTRSKVALFGQSGCIPAKVVVIGQKWL